MSSRLARANDGILLGVCSGVAKYFNVDANIVRLVWVSSILAYNFGVIAYFVFAIALPSEKEVEDTVINKY